MKHVEIEQANSTDVGEGSLRRGLTDALHSTDVAINHYRIAPGDGFPAGLHAHLDQEEVFVIVEGTATFETLDGEVIVSRGEAVRFAPGEYHAGKNDGETDLVVLGFGAPADTDAVHIPMACPGCGEAHLRLDTDPDLRFVCPACGEVHVPSNCPECGSPDLQVTLGVRNEPIVRCWACGAEYDEPPLEAG